MFRYTAGPYRVWSFWLRAEEIGPLELATKSVSLFMLTTTDLSAETETKSENGETKRTHYFYYPL